jgi:hypothetical protein
MYYYKIGWGWYEDNGSSEFVSETLYSHGELEDIIINIMEKYIDEILTDDGWIGNYNLIELVINHLPDDIKPLKQIEYTATYNLWGSNIIQEDDTEYIDKLPKQLLDKIYAHNAEIEKHLWDEKK